MKLSNDEFALLKAVEIHIKTGDISPLADNKDVLNFQAEYSGESLKDLQATAKGILTKLDTDTLTGAVNLAGLKGLI